MSLIFPDHFIFPGFPRLENPDTIISTTNWLILMKLLFCEKDHSLVHNTLYEQILLNLIKRPFIWNETTTNISRCTVSDI